MRECIRRTLDVRRMSSPRRAVMILLRRVERRRQLTKPLNVRETAVSLLFETTLWRCLMMRDPLPPMLRTLQCAH